MGTKNLLILGGYGNTGRPLARLLLQETDAHLLLAGRDLAKALALAAKLNAGFGGDRVRGCHVDAVDLILYHEDGYAFTAIPAAACLLQYHDGSISRPGLWLQANVVEPQRFMRDMLRMGIRAHRDDLEGQGAPSEVQHVTVE